jgi:hypothetical protein
MTNRAVVNELSRLAGENGGVLLPQQVVQAASDVQSPLHNYFEWDDTKAAARFRLDQARQLIRVAVTFIGNDQQQIPTRVFVSLSGDRNAGGYRPTVAVLSDDAMRAQLLEDAYDDMMRFRRKYQELSELAAIFAEMQRVQAGRLAA